MFGSGEIQPWARSEMKGAVEQELVEIGEKKENPEVAIMA